MQPKALGNTVSSTKRRKSRVDYYHNSSNYYLTTLKPNTKHLPFQPLEVMLAVDPACWPTSHWILVHDSGGFVLTGLIYICNYDYKNKNQERLIGNGWIDRGGKGISTSRFVFFWENDFYLISFKVIPFGLMWPTPSYDIFVFLVDIYISGLPKEAAAEGPPSRPPPLIPWTPSPVPMVSTPGAGRYNPWYPAL